MPDSLLADLEQAGVVSAPDLFREQLAAMQKAFNARLSRLRWNNLDGYEKTEPNRHMVEDVLTLEQGFHVRSGAFNYIRGTHRKQHPRRILTADLPDVPASEILQFPGPAGTAFLFDTSGIHRQGVPLLEPRHVVFFNYHDPLVRLQHDDIRFYRYHPLLLNAAFLGNLSEEDTRILGFGDKTNYMPAFERPSRHKMLHGALSRIHDANLQLSAFRERIAARLSRSFKKGRP